MIYHLREGVVLACICGEYRLIASLRARKYCPVVAEINADSAYIWKMIEQGLDTEVIAERTSADYGIPGDQAAEKIGLLLEQLLQHGYLTAETPNEESEL